MTWQIAIIIFITMLIQAGICTGFFILGLSSEHIKNHISQRFWIKNFREASDTGSIEFAQDEMPEEEDAKEKEKQDSEDRGFYG